MAIDRASPFSIIKEVLLMPWCRMCPFAEAFPFMNYYSLLYTVWETKERAF
jgi:hypothetical protein